MRREKLVLLGIVTMLFCLASCRKESRNDTPVIDPAKPYEIVEFEQLSPGGFADYAYQGEDEQWGQLYQYFMKVMNAMVKTRNMSLAQKMNVEAGQINAAWGYRRYFINYPSVDSQGKPLTLSEVIVVPVGIGWDHRPDKIFLGNHYTVFADFERPTGKYADYLTGTASSDAVFICSDLEGYGPTAKHTHPFLAHDIVARQTVDGAMAAMRLLENEGIKMKEGYKLFNGGYSQGGSNAMAVAKYLENDATDEEKALLPLYKTYCGGGPYSPLETWRWYETQDDIYYTPILPLTIESFKSNYPEILGAYPIERFFTQKFLDAGVLEMVRSKEYSSWQLRAQVKDNVGTAASDILSAELLDSSSELHKALETALAKCDLTSGWTPVAPIYLYHTEADQYVPYVNASMAAEGLREGNVILKKMPNIMPSDPHNGIGLYYYVKLVVGGLK